MKSDQNDMNIKGVNFVRGFLGTSNNPKNRAVDASSDQNPQQNQQQKNNSRKIVVLSPEQEDEAFKALLLSLQGSGLVAEKVSESSETRFLVKTPGGQLLRTISGEQILNLYVERKMESQPGALLRKSA
jgi:hypothetical protein